MTIINEDQHHAESTQMRGDLSLMTRKYIFYLIYIYKNRKYFLNKLMYLRKADTSFNCLMYNGVAPTVLM